MDHISRIEIFCSVVKNQGFAGAARELGITSSAISKQIQNLEQELQVKLLNRTTRKVSPTEEGTIFFARSLRALEDLSEAKDQIQDLKTHPKGILKVSFPHNLGINYLKKDIAEFAKLYPDIHLDIVLDDRIVDLVQEGFDLVIRISALQDSSLIARRLGSCPILVVASPEYIEKNGNPKTADDLSSHNILAYTRNTNLQEWRYKSPDGKLGQVSLSGTFKCDNGQIMAETAAHAVGIAILPIFYVADYINKGELISLLPEYQTWPPRDIHAVFMQNRYLSSRLRLFIEHMAEACKKLPW